MLNSELSKETICFKKVKFYFFSVSDFSTRIQQTHIQLYIMYPFSNCKLYLVDIFERSRNDFLINIQGKTIRMHHKKNVHAFLCNFKKVYLEILNFHSIFLTYIKHRHVMKFSKYFTFFFAPILIKRNYLLLI